MKPAERLARAALWAGVVAPLPMAAGCQSAVDATMPEIRTADAPAEEPLSESLFAGATFTPDLAGPLCDANNPVWAQPDDLWRSRAKFAWSPNRLLVLVESIGPAPSSPFKSHADLLHQADVIELFVDFTGEARQIMEFQLSPSNVVAGYTHVWNSPATYPTDQIDVAFYHEHQKATRMTDFSQVETKSFVEPLPDGKTRWVAIFSVAPPESAALSPGRHVWVNVMRYAYGVDAGGKRTFRQYNLIPVRIGCPHQSPRAMLELTASE